MKQATLHYDPRTRTGALVSDQGHGIECVELFTVPGNAPFFNVNGVELVGLSSTVEGDKTPGQLAYERDVARTPNYHDGTPRRPWHALPEWAQWSWERNPA